MAVTIGMSLLVLVYFSKFFGYVRLGMTHCDVIDGGRRTFYLDENVDCVKLLFSRMELKFIFLLLLYSLFYTLVSDSGNVIAVNTFTVEAELFHGQVIFVQSP